MKLIRKLYTTDPKFKWASSFPKIAAIQGLSKGLSIGPTVIEYLDPKSIKTAKRSDGRLSIDWTWFKGLHTPGFTSIGIHITPRDRGRLKLAGSIRGAYRNSTRTPIQFYLIASTAKELEKRILHEEGHGFEDLGRVDLTGLSKRNAENVLHYYATGGDLKGFYRRVSFI